jgi:alkanesulfonate monooxygenase SsuD/methylene tetrahydromethanopterin reductase-like flavin-dependent oxidoreductase (luciferase family)
MRFGIFSNNRRPSRDMGDAWERDLFEIATADRLGFDEGWISEHDSPAELLICKAAAMTKTIKLGSAVRPLAYYHPLQVATEANAVDHLTGGRYRLGIGFGFYAAWMERRGLDFSKTREMMHASIDLILKLWNAKEPIDYDGPFWKGKGMELRPKPVQQPHPPVAVAVGKTLSTVDLAAQHGFQVLTGDFAPTPRIAAFNERFVEAAGEFGRKPERNKFSVCRVVYVAETDKKARDDMRESYEETIRWEVANTPHHQVERIPKGGTFADINFDYLVDTRNLFVGSPDTVEKRIREFYDEVGGFGLLNFHAGRDYATPDKLARSMALFQSEVAPRLRPLDPDKDPPAKRDSAERAEEFALAAAGGADRGDLHLYKPPA